MDTAKIINDACAGSFSGVSAWLSSGTAQEEAIDKVLHEAAARDDVSIVSLLLKAGANPYYTDDQGRTAFNRAASNGLSALALMTEAAFRDTQKPPTQRRWKDYDLNTPSGAYGSTLITYAAKVSSAPLVAEMTHAGADITIVNGSGWTLLHCAAVMPGREDVLKDLVQTFKKQGYADMIAALSTHVYETIYNGNKVVFGEGLTALELCEARIKQDPACPQELGAYRAVLTLPSGPVLSHRPAGKAQGPLG